MARLEKRRMTESANSITTLNRQTSSTLMGNGLPTTHSNNNEIENLLYKHEHDTNQQFSVALPENILLNHSITNPIAQYSPTIKRQRSLDELPGQQIINGPLSPNKKSRMTIIDETKLPQTTHSSSGGKSSKKNRNKQQQQQLQPQTIIKTAASGIFPQQNVALQHSEESSDDVSGLCLSL
jgi:hypothetical protein